MLSGGLFSNNNINPQSDPILNIFLQSGVGPKIVSVENIERILVNNMVVILLNRETHFIALLELLFFL